ncbi:SLAP domain-containing protein [Virgibacillus dakarensis]|uniref:SLAP domain-containing protein n=1 Tax=Virgibacillus dakarensis TaxID=1917889 RepID=UPI000B447DB4|nr:SLAP domain-containing protein [Virgibacillus dakarensis]MTW87387.1 SLAP domain-containing protein [Virgibacillus dakarensis]
MQKLTFESSWEKALSVKDRNRIEQVFSETIIPKNTPAHFTLLWQALNYKKELLVTALVHNSSQQIFSFHHTDLKYIEYGKTVAEYSFTLPTLIIKPNTSMPWTFIFPTDGLYEGIKFTNGNLVIADSVI